MANLPHMTKHKGFPGRLPGTDFQFTIRRANPRGITPIKERVRHADRHPHDTKADTYFIHCIYEIFGTEPFERGNLDAGRLSWLFGREILPASEPFDPSDYEAMLVLNEDVARRNFPAAFDGTLVV